MDLIPQLLATIADGTRAIEERHDAADELAGLGDPRVDGALIDVPAGTLHHRASRDAAPEPRDFHAFAMQRHLVTVGEYEAFIDDGGYDDPSLWSAQGWRWRLEHDIDVPRFWGEEAWAPYLIANHPVVGVSWFEADAYASFRSLRLPSEREWERAARGDDARIYPWGDNWDDRACTHRNHGKRCTAPVGLFPAGPFGLFDMVGSIWQWTADETGAERDYGCSRVVCGGAWNNLPWSIGCSARNAFPPTARFSNLGLRLADDA